MSSVAYQRTYYDQYLRSSRGFAPLIDRAPVAAHLNACLEKAMTFREISDESGVHESSLRFVHHNPTGRMQQQLADRILATRPRQAVTNIGLTRRIRALNRLGWTVPQIAAEAGVDLQTIKRWRQERISFASHAGTRIVQAYDVLSMKVPNPTTRYERSAYTRTVRYAEQNGWVPPLAWDNIDDPDETPDMGEPVRGFDLDEWKYLFTTGESAQRAAERCGVTLSAVERAATRKDRRDILTLVVGARNSERKAS